MLDTERTDCTWVEDIDGNWETGCGSWAVVNNGTPQENDMRFCWYCGKKLTEARYRDKEAEDV